MLESGLRVGFCLRCGVRRIRYGLKEKVDPMARKPNYDFDRRERERLKNLKNAAKAEAKAKPAADDEPAVVPDDAESEK